MVALAIALVAINAALVALVAASGWSLVAALKNLANERAALAQCEADLALSRANEDCAVAELRHANEAIEKLMTLSAIEREARANADTAKITSGADIVGVSADVFASMPKTDDDAGVSAAPAVQAAKPARADRTKRNR